MQSEHGEIVIYRTDDGVSSLQVHLEEESVWLSQKQMADLFAKDVRTVNEHIKNVYAEGELKPGPTIRKIRIVQKEGGREVARQVDHYNLDVIISVGYRVKSQRGTQFRIWATSVLKDHLIKGYTVKVLLKELSVELTAEFGQGFSKRNLEYMRRFYLAYQNRQIAQMPSAQLPTAETSQTPSGKSEDGALPQIWQMGSAEQFPMQLTLDASGK